MTTRLSRATSFQIALGTALGVLAASAHADPFNLQSVCYLTSTIAGEAKCQLTYVLGDDFTAPAGVRKSQIKVDGVVVAQYVNDAVNPADFSAPAVSGSTSVACGVSHVVTAHIARLGANLGYERVASLPPVVCPTAP